MANEIEAYIRPRPIRVAFLVTEGEHAELVLDGIFADCFSRWGGRFSLIVPCVDGSIVPAYWPWLETYDPDIVYSYVSLSREDILEIHERLSPAEYMAKRTRAEPRLDVYGFKPDFRFTPLASLSTIFRQARYGRGSEAGAPVKILDCWHDEKEPSRFLTDNFGTYLRSFGTSMFPVDATQAASLRTIVAPERLIDRRSSVPRDLDVVPDELEAFNNFTHRRVSSLSMASILFAPKLDFHTTRWSGTFNLVIGNTFADRLLYWNARLLIPAWLDTDLCCLRVDPEQLEDPAFVVALSDFLKQRNRVNSGSGGQSSAVIRSMSLTAERLEEIKSQLVGQRPWGNLRTEVVQSLDEVVPDEASLRSAREGNRFGTGMIQRPDWTRFIWTPPALRPPVVEPDHLADAPPGQRFVQGYWASDLDIELDEPGSTFGDPNRWSLPRRWRLASAFGVKRVNSPMHELPPRHRRSREGTLAVFLKGDAPIESVGIPTGSNAIYHGLARDGAWAQDDLERGRVQPPPKVKFAEPSNEARYLTGVLGLAGGLRNATAVLLHPFLMELFGQLGGTPKLAAEKVQPTINALRKRTDPTQAVFDIRDEKERSALAHLIVRAAAGLKAPRESVSFKDLTARWAEYRANYWKVRSSPQTAADDGVDWDSREAKSLEDRLIELRQRQMIFQGHRWVCEECHHKNWIDLSALDSQLICVVCRTETQTPIDINWLFRPNEFLIECLRDRSALSLVWALHVLRGRALHSFFYAGPTKFFYSTEAADLGRADAEADLLVVIDGKAVLCEVKSSWSVVTKADIRKLVALAQRLRPDVAILAIMEDGAGLAAEIDEARTDLGASGIDLELLTWRPDEILDGPYLV